MFNKDVLEAIELLRKEIRTAQKDSQERQRSKIKDLVETIIEEISTKENRSLKEELVRRGSLMDKQRNSELYQSQTIEKLTEELSETNFKLSEAREEIENLRIYEGKVNCILNNHVAFKDISIPNADLLYKIKVIIDYFLTEESTKE